VLDEIARSHRLGGLHHHAVAPVVDLENRTVPLRSFGSYRVVRRGETISGATEAIASLATANIATTLPGTAVALATVDREHRVLSAHGEIAPATASTWPLAWRWPGR
jgi:hypothetical protein